MEVEEKQMESGGMGMWQIADGHCDMATRACDQKESFYHNLGQVDLCRLGKENPAFLQVFAIWLRPEQYKAALEQTLLYLDYYDQELCRNHLILGHVNTYEDLLANEQAGRGSALVTLEGGEALMGQISTLRMLYRLGVRGMSLTWNRRNALADGVSEGEPAGGLSVFGREVVLEMNRLGMLLDVSHLAEQGFWEVSRLAKAPFVASHSNAQAVCRHRRNLSDAQLKAVADSGGVVGINLYSPFLSQNGRAQISDVMAHIGHMMKVIGEEHIALGCDFDGMAREDAPEGLTDAACLPALLQAVNAAYGKRTAEKIAFLNWRRVLLEVLGAGRQGQKNGVS